MGTGTESVRLRSDATSVRLKPDATAMGPAKAGRYDDRTLRRSVRLKPDATRDATDARAPSPDKMCSMPGLVQAIACLANGEDVARDGGIVFELAAQFGYVRVDCTREHRRRVAPDFVQQVEA